MTEATTSSVIADADPDLLVRQLGDELIVNGGFENHANAGTNRVFFYTGLEGWTAAGEGRYIEVQTGDYNTGNTVGNSIVELDAFGGQRNGIKQTFTVSEAGTYQVSFDYGVRARDIQKEPWWFDSASNSMLVIIDGELVQMVGSGVDANFDRGFQTRTFDLELDAGEHIITFLEDGYYTPLTDEGTGATLDNVSIREVEMVLETGELSGTVYFDGDQDGQHDAGEQGLGGQTVYLLNSDQSYVLDEDGNPVTTLTDANGDYSFTGLDAGEYRVGFVDSNGRANGGLDLSVQNPVSQAPDGSDMAISGAVSVEAGIETGNLNSGLIGAEIDTTITVTENNGFVYDFDTVCQLVSEDVYFMVGEEVCARIGRNGFDDAETTRWNNSTTTAVPFFVFLEEPADNDLTFTVRLTVDPSKVAVGGAGYAPDGFAYLTDQANEIDAPRFEEIEVTVRAGQTQSDAFYVGTEAASTNYAFGIEIDSIYNNDLNEACEQVKRVVTTPVAIDLNRDGEIGVTGETTSKDKTGLTIGETVHFDMDADGVAERIEWFDGSGDGILIDNRDGEAATDMNGARLFGDDNGVYSDGYEKLRANFDSNGDGTITGDELDGLMVWVDDGDAVVEAGELQSLSSYAITEISGQVSTSTDASGREVIRSTVSQDFEETGNVTYRLEGPDADLFTVSADGQVNFREAPDYENPQDEGLDNIYNVTLIRETDLPNCKPARENLRIEVRDKPSLGDTVWYDNNRNGVLDNGETGAAGVTVNLIQSGIVVATMITDSNGNYLFDDLSEGDYQVQFVAPSGYAFTTQAAVGPEEANNDSDAGADGTTGVISLSEGEQQRNVDAGLVQTNKPPQAQDDDTITCADEPATVNVLANDSDPDGDSLTITSVGGQAISEGQTVVVNGVDITLTDGELVFDGQDAFEMLDIDEFARESFDYTISDGNGGTASASVNVKFCGTANSVESLLETMPDSGNFKALSGLQQNPLGDYGFDVEMFGTNDARFDGNVFEQAYYLNVFMPSQEVGNINDTFGAQIAQASEVFQPGQSSNFNGNAAADNLDLINWIIAQDFEGDNADAVDGGFNGWEVQFAIWELTDQFNSSEIFAGKPEFGSLEDTQYILDQAAANGEGFQAGVGDTIGLIVEPDAADENWQPFIIGLDYEQFDCLC